MKQIKTNFSQCVTKLPQKPALRCRIFANPILSKVFTNYQPRPNLCDFIQISVPGNKKTLQVSNVN
jgi:hypothetical protein